MSRAHPTPHVARPRTAWALGALASLALLLDGATSPNGALQGLLIAFVTLAGLSFGATALLSIGRLTGGRWAASAAPALLMAAAASPVFLPAFVAILIGARHVFPWMTHPDAAGAGVPSLYLNFGFFGLRGVLSLLAFLVLAWFLLRDQGGRLLAAVGLIVYAIATDFLAIDWVLSLEPRFSSSAFGAQIAVQQILEGLALTLALGSVLAPSEAEDLAGLTLAAALGTLYMVVMSFIVNWYGDQPERASWYLERANGAWLWIGIGALFCGALFPIGALLLHKVRADPTHLRLVGASVLVGIVLHNVWLMAPACDARALPSALLAFMALGGIAFAFATWWQSWIGEGRALHAP